MKRFLLLLLLTVLSMPVVLAQITEAEYFWGADPGEGGGTALVAKDGNLNTEIEALLGSNLVLPGNGEHIFSVRVKDTYGKWGPVFKRTVKVNQVPSSTPVTILQAEYFWDTDPGEGNAVSLLALDGNLDSEIEKLIKQNTGIPTSEGVHSFNVRIKDKNSVWGPVFRRTVVISQVASSIPVTIQQAEYFWNTDPGQGNGLAVVAVDGNLDGEIESVIKNGAPLVQEGLNTFNVRIKDSNGTWGPVFTTVVDVKVALSVHEDSLLKESTKLFPVPANDVINLTMNNDIHGKGGMKIFDITGKLVKYVELDKRSNWLHQKIYITSLASGMYMVKINLEDRLIVKRFIK